MNILKFDKKELGNLQCSLQREFIATNRAGGYMSTTITCCNTRKYHGLMVCPVESSPGDYQVLLSSIDETVIQRDHLFNLALHQYPATYEPKGHKYIESFEYTPTPTIVYRVGGVQLKKELLWLHNKEQLLIRYTLLKAVSPTKLRLRPFLAFRDIHALCKANTHVDGRSTAIPGGVSNSPYPGMPTLYLQMNHENEFVPAPDWYENFIYREEQNRGYHYMEDLLTTGFFEFDIKCGQSVILSCSTSEVSPASLTRNFNAEIKKRSEKTEFHSCLRHAARQFLITNNKHVQVVAGFPWLGYTRGRDRLVALPGITLEQGNTSACVDVLKSLTKRLKGGLYSEQGCNFFTLDGPLWYFWTLQMLEEYEGEKFVIEHFGKDILAMFKAYVEGINGIDGYLDDCGLIRAASTTKPLTWMAACVEGVPVTARAGYQVEVNALWYNALCYSLHIAEKMGNKSFVKSWSDKPELVKSSFTQKFLLKEGYLADYVDGDVQNKYIRPNQVIACSLRYKMITEDNIVDIIDVVTSRLLTAKGLRTLSPDNALYEPIYSGNETERSYARFQGSVHSWLLYHYIRANIEVYGRQYLFSAGELIAGFEEDFLDYGIGTLAEVYDGDPPHRPAGVASHAMSVGSILLAMDYIERYRDTKKNKK